MPSVTMPPIPQLPRPSTWFPGTLIDRLRQRRAGSGLRRGPAQPRGRGSGRDGGRRGRDESRLARARELAERNGLTVDWRMVDLEGQWPDFGSFDAV